MIESQIDSIIKAEIDSIVQTTANVVILRWLSSKGLPNSASTLKNTTDSICDLILQEKIIYQEFRETFRLIEESSGKVIYFREIPDLALLNDKEKITQHLTSNLPPAKSKNLKTIRLPEEPTLNYLLINEDEIRFKFTETHFNFSPDFQKEVLIRSPFTASIVVSIDRKTGFTLIFLDTPGKKHPYPTNKGRYPEGNFYNHYVNKIQLLFPLMRVFGFGANYHRLLKIVEAEKRIFKVTTNSDFTKDNVKRVHHGADLMTSTTFSTIILDENNDILHDYATVTFLSSASGKKLLEDVYVRIYPGEGKISIPAIRLPFEVNYVISTIKAI